MLAPLLLALALAAGGAPVQDAEAPARPRLAVVLLVDQLLPDQLERLEPHLDGGLGRLWREGRVYRRALLAHGRTYTAPGHVSAATGTWPSTHGVVGNTWFDRASRAIVYCCEDDAARMVTSAGVRTDDPRYRRSARTMRVPGIADHVKAAVPGGRTLALCAKDRAAIALAGHTGDLALWWSWRTDDGFVSSSVFGEALPAWVRSWNAGWAERASGFLWETTFAGDLRAAGTAEDDREGEYATHGWTRTMPHRLHVLSDGASEAERARLALHVYDSALGDAFVQDLALRALETGDYGTDDDLDLLALAFASTDTVGHLFGPRSVEVTDVVLRLDALLDELFAALDERVGAGRWVCALTSDHGVMQLPEELAHHDVGGVRVPGGEVARLRKLVTDHCDATWGPGLVLDVDKEGVSLDRERLAELEVEPADVRAELRDLAVDSCDWVARGHTQEELVAAQRAGTDDPWLRLAAHSWVLERSPDVALQARPWHLIGEPAGTTHGSPYEYDRSVPLIFLGPGFAAEQRFDDVTSCDLAPTLLGACGIVPDFAFDGRDLSRD